MFIILVPAESDNSLRSGINMFANRNVYDIFNVIAKRFKDEASSNNSMIIVINSIKSIYFGLLFVNEEK